MTSPTTKTGGTRSGAIGEHVLIDPTQRRIVERAFTSSNGSIEAVITSYSIHYTKLYDAHGLAPEIMTEADGVLPPILGDTEYNHLSVRSAASIILDRLLGS